MATRQDDSGSRLWRGMRHLIFGENSEPTLRAEIEEAIDEAEDEGSRRVAGDLSPAERQMLRNLLHFGEQTADDVASPAATSSRCLGVSFDGLVARLRRRRPRRLPVYREKLDDVVGMVHIKDVFMAHVEPSLDRC